MFPFTKKVNSEEQIAQHIRELRLEMGFTQEQFAAKLGVSFPTVNRWENKKTVHHTNEYPLCMEIPRAFHISKLLAFHHLKSCH